MKTTDNSAIAKAIFERYREANDGDVQGLCALIASDIAAATGGRMIAGYLCWASCRRSHWWVLADGTMLDPMGDWQMEGETFHREVEHEDHDLGEDIALMHFHYQLPEVANV